MTGYATRYACRGCGRERFLPERPLSPTRRVYAGCPECEARMPHHPVGHPAGTGLARGWRS